MYGGSADVMVRSFDRRIESLFRVTDPLVKKELINMLVYNLKDNVNAYIMREDGSYEMKVAAKGEAFNVHKEFFKTSKVEIEVAELFS